MTGYTKDTEKRIFASLCGGLMLMLPAIATSAPNEKSIADFEVCLVDSDNDESEVAISDTARVCSSKELSNVILQCDDGGATYFIKHDDLDDPESPSFEFLLTAFEGVFQCPEGDEVVAVFVKSGSVKANRDGLPGGAGRGVWTPDACPVDCPEPNLDEEEEGELN